MAGNVDKQSQNKAVPPKESDATTIRISESPITGLRVADFDAVRRTAQGVSPLLRSPDFDAARLATQSLNESILTMGRDLGLVDSGLRNGPYHTTLNLASSAEMTQLSSRLARIEQGLNELKAGQAENEQVDEPLLDDLIETTASARDQTDSMLMARLHLPPQWLTDQQLVPATLLDRLEEYRSDENILLLFGGTFGGAILGVLSSWFVAETTAVTRGSVLFLVLLIVATMLCGYGAYRIRQRSVGVKNRMFLQSSSSMPDTSPPLPTSSTGEAPASS